MSIFNNLRCLARRVVHPHTYSSEAYVAHLRDVGVSIGEGSIFWAPTKTTVDETAPHMLEIGKYAKVTQGVIILAHDYSGSVCTQAFGEYVGEHGKTIIGDNVFLGMNSIILAGSTIGDNCIVGAGSIVSGSFDSNTVIAGNPAKVICSLSEFHSRRANREISGAIEEVKSFKERNGKWPNPCDVPRCLWLFLPRNEESIESNPGFFNANGIDRAKLKDAFLKSEPKFSSFDAFLENCKEE